MRYVRFLVHFPSIVLILVLAMVVAAGALGVLLNPLPSFSNPTKGFEARGTVLSGRLLAYARMSDETDLFYPYPSALVNDSISRRSVRASDDDVDVDDNVSRRRRDVSDPTLDHLGNCTQTLTWRVRMVYRASGAERMFTASSMRAVCTHDQEKYRSQSTFDETCWPLEGDKVTCCPTWSLGHITALAVGKSSCHEIDDDDVTFVENLLQECLVHYTDDCLGPESSCNDVPENCTQYDTVYTILHYLTPTDFQTAVTEGSFDLPYVLTLPSLENRGDEAFDFYKAHMQESTFTGDGVKVVAIGATFKSKLFGKYVLSDAIFICIGCCVVLLIMWVYVGSFFITIMTIISIFMSMIVAYFLYHTVFRLPFFPFMNLMTVILVIGVGADDCFVYVDLWKLAKKEYGGGRKNLVPTLRETMNHAAATMFVTSFTTSSALFSSAVSSITAIRCFSIFAGSSILVNLVMTLTWVPATVIVHDKYFLCDEKSEGCKCCGCWFGIGRAYDSVATYCSRFFEVYLPIIVEKLRFLWIVLLLGLGIGGFCVVFVEPRLRLPSATGFQLFKSSNIFEQYDQIYKQKYRFENERPRQMPVLLVWGIEPVDNGNHWDPDSTGTTVLDPTFDPSSPAAQEWLYDLCMDLQNASFHSDSADPLDEVCFIDIFRDFMSGPCNNPYVGDVSPCCNQNNADFPYSSSLFTQCIVTFYELQCQLFPCKSSLPGLRFDSDDNIVAMVLNIESNVEESLVYAVMNDYWTEVNGWVEERMATAPQGLRKGWFVSIGGVQFGFFDLQRGLATGAPLSVGISLVIATCVLLIAIRNVLVTLYAIVSIASAVFVTIGTVVLMGWELNIMESTTLALAVGMSVDFTIHLGVAYGQVTASDRKTRSLQALRTLGAAVTLAAVTTFTAGAFMMPATVLSYVQLGTFLMLVMTFSWVYGMFLFMSLLMTIGPQGSFAQVSMSCFKCSKDDAAKSKDNGEEMGHVNNVETSDEVKQP